jgi:hypothetical protein
MSDSLPRPATKAIVKSIFWNWWSAVIGGLYGLYGVLQTVDSQSPKFPSWLKAIWDQLYVMPAVSLKTFLMAVFGSVAFLAVIGTYRYASAYYGQYEALTAHKLIPHVIRKESQVYATMFSPWQCPLIHATVAIKFENTVSYDLALKRMAFGLCERMDKKGRIIKEIPLRGRDPQTVRHMPGKLQDFDNPQHEIEIAGLVTKGGNFSGKYFFQDREMLVADLPGDTLVNKKHFLRLTVEAVSQRPYCIDLEVDWTQPGFWILSATPVAGTEKILKGKPIWEQEIEEEGDMNFRLRKELKKAYAEKKQIKDKN